MNKPSTDIPFNVIQPTNNLLNPTAIFDSTTEFIWGDDKIIDSIVLTIGNNMKEKCTYLPTSGKYDCECAKESSNFPPIYFTFETSK